MGNAAPRLMTLEEFLAWDAPGDLPWQLFEGHPVAMAPLDDAHGTVVGNLTRLIGNALTGRPPCRLRVEAGVRLPHRRNSYYVPDIAVSCHPAEPGRPDIPDPLLIVEVLSPSTEEHDRKTKLPNYRWLASVVEVLYVDPSRAHCELYRRTAAGRWEFDVVNDLAGSLSLASCDAEIPLTEVYANVTLIEDPA